tara:strand:- start:2615 stop:3355 length:741 start_codon:yes stop_codon:yes gene_type:complete
LKVLGVIPARYNSSRFPGKPLAKIDGKSMIERVFFQSKKSNRLTDLIVATDDIRIAKHVREFGGKAMLTSDKHLTGTERCNEVISKLTSHYDIIINIQGDEPLLDPKQISEVIELFKKDEVKIGTLARKIYSIEDLLNKNIVKIKFDKDMSVKSFKRVVFLKEKPPVLNKKKLFYQHVGIYAYRYSILGKICKLLPTKNEQINNLEQLRWLDNNYSIYAGITKNNSYSVDAPEDIKKIEQIIRDFT